MFRPTPGRTTIQRFAMCAAIIKRTGSWHAALRGALRGVLLRLVHLVRLGYRLGMSAAAPLACSSAITVRASNAEPLSAAPRQGNGYCCS